MPADALLGGVEGQGFIQMMQDLSYERALLGVNCAAVMEHAFKVSTEYAKDRKMFGKTLLDLQNTRFVLAEVKTMATIGRVFADFTIQKMIDGSMTTDIASMAKWWLSEEHCRVIDKCLQLFGGHGYILEYPIARMYVDARIEMIYAGANELMKDLIGRSL